MDPVWHGFQQVPEELAGGLPASLGDELGDRKSTRAVDTNEQIGLVFGGLHLGDINVKEADRIALEALSLRLVALNVRLAGYSVSLQAAWSTDRVKCGINGSNT